eukprot:TRINITY_DN65744_c3_g1_i1.p1 TRINITY_DN65744_c3_g1~~TRINITY_DN65744_c3_g1_i1.p1  ORF type:complete len:381 (-),score=37.21 TRINITY_DN65744_c3_g1_i1:683-1825(-)
MPMTSRSPAAKRLPIVVVICLIVVMYTVSSLYSQQFRITIERAPAAEDFAQSSVEKEIRPLPTTGTDCKGAKGVPEQTTEDQPKTTVKHTKPSNRRIPVLPTEQEIQQWERVALNFSRAGHTAMISKEQRPAYPLTLYDEWLHGAKAEAVCPQWNPAKGTGWKFFGEKSDGGWPVCMTPAIQQKNCVVYSFGVGADYSFEKAISPYCEVHSFDPTPHIVAMMKKIEHKINWHFHPWGLDSYAHNGTFQMYTTGDRPVSVRFESIPSLMTLFGHKKVDVVKIDVEGYEVLMWHDVFGPNTGVEQLLFELHPLTRSFVSAKEKKDHGVDASVFFDWTDWLVMLTAAFRHGFKPFWAKKGRYNHAGGLQEFAFLRQFKEEEGG